LGHTPIIGNSPSLQTILRLVPRIASHRHPVLITGETGTGKELLARAIHAQCPLSDKPFVPVDCGALSPFLIESELFGHARGAFTGAVQARTGLLVGAGRGTVFFDEIAELPLGLQAKLFRVLQESEVRPVGSNVAKYFEARVIAATACDLDDAVSRGGFRKELYFRLNVVSLKLPALRQRKDDIPALVRHFVERHGGSRHGVSGISPEAMTRLVRYEWPGNVRELENCIKRALMLGSGQMIKVADLPPNILRNVENRRTDRAVISLKESERRAIIRALEATAGDRLRAAKLLGIGKTTIYRKLKQYGLEDSFPLAPSKGSL